MDLDQRVGVLEEKAAANDRVINDILHVLAGVLYPIFPPAPVNFGTSSTGTLEHAFKAANPEPSISVERIKEALEKALDDREYAQADDSFISGMMEAVVNIIEQELGLKEAK